MKIGIFGHQPRLLMAISEDGMNKLCAHHGLDPKNDNDADVDKEIKNSMDDDEADDLENRAKAGDEAREELAAVLLEKYSNRIGSDPKAIEAWKHDLIVNRAGAILKLEALSVQEPKKGPLHNRATAGVPSETKNSATKDDEQKKAHAKAVKNRANQLMTANPKLSFANAWRQAESEQIGK